MTSTSNHIIDALMHRYATDAFDDTKVVSDEDMHSILESGRLAPSSNGLEPWQFIVVGNRDLRDRIRSAAWNQKKVTSAARLIVIARRTHTRETLVDDIIRRTATTRGISEVSLTKYRNMVEKEFSSRTDEQLDEWHARQVYIPLGMMTETAALLGINTTAMEGFDAASVDDILGLEKHHLTATLLLTLGYAQQDDERASWKKVRRAFDDVVTFLS